MKLLRENAVLFAVLAIMAITIIYVFDAGNDSITIEKPAETVEVEQSVTPELVFLPDVTEKAQTAEPTATPQPTPKKKVDERTGYVEGKTYTMRIYHYCACKRCTPGTGITASGKKATVGMVAMWGLPFGTIIEVNGKQYVVEDRGVGARTVDIFCESHAETDKRGTYIAQVKIVKLGGNA